MADDACLETSSEYSYDTDSDEECGECGECEDAVTRYWKEYVTLNMQRLHRFDYMVVYICIFVLVIISAIIVFIGTRKARHSSIVLPSTNPWIIAVAWIISTFLAYVGVLLLWENLDCITGPPKDLLIYIYYMIGSFILVLWAVIFYHADNLPLAFWISVAAFAYRLWLCIYIWRFNPISGILFVPSLLLQVYILYLTLHVISLNNIKM